MCPSWPRAPPVRSRSTRRPTGARSSCSRLPVRTPSSSTRPGYINQEGFRNVTKSATLEKGKLKVIPFSYERAASLEVAYATAPGHSLPSPLPGLSLFNTGLPAPGEMHIVGGADPATVDGLWPFSDGYTVWAGTCDQSDPALNGQGFPRPLSVPVDAGDTASVTVALAPVMVRTVEPPVPGFDPVGVDGVTLIATPTNPAGCEGADGELTLGTTSGGGYLATSLPAGSWLVEPDSGSDLDCYPVDPISTCPQGTGTLVVVDAGGLTPDPQAVITLPDMAVSDS